MTLLSCWCVLSCCLIISGCSLHSSTGHRALNTKPAVHDLDRHLGQARNLFFYSSRVLFTQNALLDHRRPSSIQPVRSTHHGVRDHATLDPVLPSNDPSPSPFPGNQTTHYLGATRCSYSPELCHSFLSPLLTGTEQCCIGGRER